MAATTMGCRPIGRSLTFYRSARRASIERSGHSLEDKLWTFLLKDLYNPCDAYVNDCMRPHSPCSACLSRCILSDVIKDQRNFGTSICHRRDSSWRDCMWREYYCKSCGIFRESIVNGRVKKINWKFDIRCTIFIWQSWKLFASQSRYLVAEEKWDSACGRNIFIDFNWLEMKLNIRHLNRAYAWHFHRLHISAHIGRVSYFIVAFHRIESKGNSIREHMRSSRIPLSKWILPCFHSHLIEIAFRSKATHN